MPRNHRTGPQNLKQARKLLSDARLLAFFRAAAKEPDPMAARMMQRSLEVLGSLDAVFAEYVGDEPWSMEITLKVVQVASRTFRITFGYAGGHVGDGGTYRVVYSAGSSMLRLELDAFWVH